jgi:hypothetical protein
METRRKEQCAAQNHRAQSRERTIKRASADKKARARCAAPN